MPHFPCVSRQGAEGPGIALYDEQGEEEPPPVSKRKRLWGRVTMVPSLKEKAPADEPIPYPIQHPMVRVCNSDKPRRALTLTEVHSLEPSIKW